MVTTEQLLETEFQLLTYGRLLSYPEIMRIYAREAIREDRKNLINHIELIDMGSENADGELDPWYQLDENSLLNAPQIELL